MTLGTYSTIDCPTKKIGEAFQFLTQEFEKIGGKVFQIMNPHDFGAYPSFEIDYPKGLSDLEIDPDDDDVETLSRLEDKEIFENQADEIEKKYNQKFAKYL